jgi:hypothetical protein
MGYNKIGGGFWESSPPVHRIVDQMNTPEYPHVVKKIYKCFLLIVRSALRLRNACSGTILSDIA